MVVQLLRTKTRSPIYDLKGTHFGEPKVGYAAYVERRVYSGVPLDVCHS